MDLSRQNLFIEEEIQQKLKNIKVMIAGAGIGSYIAECLVRLGVENIYIFDGDVVEESNLNRQNYIFDDINSPKVDSLKNRLLSINPAANVVVESIFLNRRTLMKYIKNKDFVINTIDFDHPAFLYCNYICKKNNVTEIFPMNLALGSAAFVSDSGAYAFSDFFNIKNYKKETKDSIIEYVFSKINKINNLLPYIEKYELLKKTLDYKDPQIGIASFITASLVSTLIIKILKGSKIKKFPELYHIDMEFDL